MIFGLVKELKGCEIKKYFIEFIFDDFFLLWVNLWK